MILKPYIFPIKSYVPFGFNICCVVVVVSQLLSSVQLFLQPHGLQPTSFLFPLDFPGKNAGVSYHFLLQGIFLTQGSNPYLLHLRQILLPLSQEESILACLLVCFILNNQAILETAITPILVYLTPEDHVCSKHYHLQFSSHTRVSDEDMGVVDPQVGQKKICIPPIINLLYGR